MLYHLAKYQDAQQRIYLELRQLFGNADDINISDASVLNKAHCLRAFVEETWRLRAFGGLPRVLPDDYRVDFVDKQGKKDYFILPKGCSIFFNNIHILRTSEYGWTDGNTWNYENYLDENGHFVKTNADFDDRFKHSIFGSGRRICPAIGLARKEVMFALAILIYKYEFCGPNGKGDADFVIPSRGLGAVPSKSKSITVFKR